MAMICVNGCKECNGCMACYEENLEFCCECARDLPSDECYEDEQNLVLCKDCLLLLHKKEY